MASSNPGVTHNNSSASKAREWGRSGEPGSAFRGLTRGRGGGRNSGRGGRGLGLGSNGGGRRVTDTSPKADNSSAKYQLGCTTKPPVETESLKSTPSAPPPTPSRPKSASKKSSRNIPSLVINPPPLAAGSSTPSRSSNRRRRPQHDPKTPNTAGPQFGATLHPPHNVTKLRPHRSRSGPTTPAGFLKDALPHLSDTPDGDMRHNIDALVERMRSVAMADNRPNTPGSHVDWAGDDDQSLPDLDDWGVTTENTGSVKDDDGPSPSSHVSKPSQHSLRKSESLSSALPPLPPSHTPPSNLHDAESKQRTGTSATKDVPDIISSFSPEPSTRHSSAEVDNGKAQAALPSITASLAMAKVSQTLNDTEEPTIPSRTLFSLDSSDQSSVYTSLVSPLYSPPIVDIKGPLHPSLPPKPVAAIESLATKSKFQRKPQDSATATPIATSPPATGSSPIESPPLVTTEKSDPPHVPLVIQPPGSEIEIMEAPSAEEITWPGRALDSILTSKDPSSEKSLTTKNQDDPSPSYIALNKIIRSPVHPSNSIHRRNHTIGRPLSFLDPSMPQKASQQRLSRSGASSPRGNVKPYNGHNRTHSTPPPGSSLHREFSARRPIITGNAMSMLVRTIGQTNTTQANGNASKD